jgi:ATP-dependent Lon protease
MEKILQHDKSFKKNKKRKISESSSSSSSEADEEEEEEEEEEENTIVESSHGSEDEDDDEEEGKKNKKLFRSGKKGKPLNIILQIGGSKRKHNRYDDDDDSEDLGDEEDSYWEDIDEEDEDINEIDTEDEDEPVSSDEDSDSESETESDSIKDKSKKKSLADLATTRKENELLLAQLESMEHKNASVQKCIDLCKKQIAKCSKKEEKKNKKHKAKNSRIFRRIIRDKNAMNDSDFFNKLDVDHQKKIIKELREINKFTRIEKPYRMTLLESPIPTQFKAAAMKKINLLRGMDPDCGEYFKIKNWVDTFMRMPFGKYETLNVTYEDGVDRCHEFMEHAQKTLDSAVYGLNDAKMQIMQMLGQLITNPKALGAAIAIHGPPGTGKTSLVKEGISKILNRPFAFIALGGATDSSFLEGHSYTYEGSTWGKIVQILIDSKCMNPVIYFDELDKISETPKGEEIAGILTHLTDTSQNSQVHDKYFAEIDFDLSKCLFIFSYNDESKINPILKDRMYRIQTSGYNQKQKTVISNQYLLPRIRDQVKFKAEEILIPDETIHYLIDSYCNKEDGVRNLKRCLEIIHTKINLYRLMKPNSNLFEEDMSLKVQFPFTVTKQIVDKLIKKGKESPSAAIYSLYA